MTGSRFQMITELIPTGEPALPCDDGLGVMQRKGVKANLLIGFPGQRGKKFPNEREGGWIPRPVVLNKLLSLFFKLLQARSSR
jgi:hypothetical protein